MPRAKRIHQLPAADRPREKLHKKGAGALSDFELLEVIIGKGAPTTDVGTIARSVLKLIHKDDTELNFKALLAIKGINTATAGRILASVEFARRYLIKDAEPLQNIRDFLARLDDIRTKQQEYVVCLSLDGGQRLIAKRTVTVGTLDAAIVHPREIYADAIADRAASIVIAHNHPSGDTKPSHKDIELTQQLSAAGQLLGITLRDHLIITKTGYFSFKQHHLL